MSSISTITTPLTIEELSIYSKSKPSTLIVIDFNAIWCGPCKAYAPTFKEFAAENDSLKCFSLDCQVAPEIAEDFDVKSIPVTILFKNGEEIARKPGKLTKEQLSDFIDQDF